MAAIPPTFVSTLELLTSCANRRASSTASFFVIIVLSRIDVLRTDCVRVLDCDRFTPRFFVSCSLFDSCSLRSCKIRSRSSASSQISMQ